VPAGSWAGAAGALTGCRVTRPQINDSGARRPAPGLAVRGRNRIVRTAASAAASASREPEDSVVLAVTQPRMRSTTAWPSAWNDLTRIIGGLGLVV
jgi:hypothetical protein